MNDRPGFSTELIQLPEASVVRVSGELDLNTCPEFRLCLDEAVERDGSQVIVDLTAATFIDSAAIGALIVAARTLADRGSGLEVCCRSNNVARTLAVTGIGRMLTLRTVEEQT